MAVSSVQEARAADRWWRWLLAALWLGVPCLFALIGVQTAADPFLMLRDPVHSTESPWYLGAVGHLGTLGWAVGWASLGLTAVVASCGGQRPGLAEDRLFFGSAAALTLYLAVDDMVVIHEELIARVVDETVTYGVYGVVVLAWAFAWRRRLLGPHRGLVVAAGAAFASSIAVDRAFSSSEAEWRILVEDGAKILGIGTWALWSVRTSVDHLVSTRTRIPG